MKAPNALGPPPAPSPSSGRRALGKVAALGRSDTARASGLAAAMMAGNVIGLVFTVVFARVLGATGYGSLAALLAAFLILSVPGSALQVTVARRVSAAAAAGDPHPAAGVWDWLRGLGLFTLGMTALAALGREQIASAVGVDLAWAAAATIPTAGAWLLLCVERGALQGIGRYKVVGWSLVVEQIGRLAAGLALVAAGLDVAGAFLGTGVSMLAIAGLLGLLLRRADAPAEHPRAARLRELVGRAWAPLLALALVAVLQNVDVIVVKHRFDGDPAGSYAAASVAAKAIIWIALGLGFYLLPETARRSSLGLDAQPVLVRTLALIAALGLPMVIVYAIAGRLLIGTVFGDDLTLATGALPWLGAAMSLLGAAYLCVQYLLGLGRWRFIILLGIAAALEPILLSVVGSDLTDIAVAAFALQLALVLAMLAAALRVARHRPAAAPA